MTFCSAAGRGDELLRRFASLTIGPSSLATTATPAKATTLTTAKTTATTTAAAASYTPTAAATTATTATTAVGRSASQGVADTKPLLEVLAALRKLREGIVASKRVDDFAVQAYLFCIRLSILAKQPESYHPALLHILRTMHRQQPLTSVELQEVVGYLVLDTACRRRQLAEAFALRRLYGLRDGKVTLALAALVHDNYVQYGRLKRAVDGHQAKLMEWAEPELRLHALKCVGKTYLTVERDFLERTTDSRWDELQKKDGVGWELKENRIIIRRVKGGA